MPVVWDDKADAMLLASILATANTKVDNIAVAKMMGGEYNALAIRNRIARIKLKARALTDEVSTPPNTPHKATKQAAGKKRKEAKDEAGAEDKPSADKPTTTTKKARKAVKAEVVKEENEC
ncbi:hypothetical protein MauCBS54593_002687 [Microsporum audouinii]